MSVAVAIVLVGAGAFGSVLAAGSARGRSRPSLDRRLRRYIGGEPQAPGAAVLTRLVDVFAGDEDIAVRLARAGRSDVQRWRARRAGAALAGGAAAIVAGLVTVAIRPAIPPVVVLVLVACCAPAGLVLVDLELRSAAKRRSRRIVAGLPVAVDLLTIVVTAGESLRGALDCSAQASPGPVGDELARVVRELGTAVPLRDGLEAMARRVGVPPVDRLVDTLVVAGERGAPLGDALQALGADVRDEARHALLEEGARRQIWMLVPVVGLILPAALLFAFYPALVALDGIVGGG